MVFEFASFILLATGAFLGGCGTNIPSSAGDLILNVKGEIECSNAASSGYIWLSGQCCLDSNHNGRCDLDEKGICQDECSVTKCNGKEFYECLHSQNGCSYYSPKGIVKGQCGVDCLTNADCATDQKCSVNNKCEANKCGDGVCDSGENCNTCSMDCIKQGEICCNTTVIVGACCSDNDCNGQSCIANQCVNVNNTASNSNLTNSSCEGNVTC